MCADAILILKLTSLFNILTAWRESVVVPIFSKGNINYVKIIEV